MRTLTQHLPFIYALAKRISIVIGLAIINLSALAGCSSSPDQDYAKNGSKSYTRSYHQALQKTEQAVPASQQSVDNFVAVYTGLTGEKLSEKVAAAYAENLYFSDTLNVITDRQDLIDYLAEVGNHIDDIQVTIMSVSHDKADVYVRWGMTTKFSVLGKDIDAQSVGISHLRFNQQGQIILHQDFWDSSEGLLTHLPFIGGVVRWTRRKM